MHAYLIIGKTGWEELARKIKAKIFEFPIQKIEDVRSLNNLIRLSFDEPTLIVSQNIHEATEEALNAFLKNLEEPQENIYFAFTAPSVSTVLPTIVSRCQLVRVDEKSEEIGIEELEKFLGLSTAQKLEFIDKIKDRNEAIELTERLIKFMHRTLHENRVKYSQLAEKIMIVQETYTCLKANGNVNLHLSKMAINL
jgi:DNA polymerase III delta prime subunit